MNNEKQLQQDLLNHVTLNVELEKFLGGLVPDDATLDLLLEYPGITKDWLTKAGTRIREFGLRCQPMKPKTDNLDDQDLILCPACGYGLMPTDGDDDFGTPQYCSECGQLLQWDKEIPKGLHHIAVPCVPDTVLYGVSDDCGRIISYTVVGFEFVNGSVHIILDSLNGKGRISIHPTAIGSIVFETKKEAEHQLMYNNN